MDFPLFGILKNKSNCIYTMYRYVESVLATIAFSTFI
jgi:hypothetical protein